MGDSKSFAAAADISVRSFRGSGAKVISGRHEDRGAGALSALSHRVYLGGDLLCGQPADCISERKAGDRRITVWRVCLGDDELRCCAALGHPSLAATVRSSLNHYRAYRAYSTGGIADCIGGVEMGPEEVDTHRRSLVIVNNLNIIGITIVPSKTDSPLLIDADAVLPLAISLQCFQVVAGRAVEICQHCCAV